MDRRTFFSFLAAIPGLASLAPKEALAKSEPPFLNRPVEGFMKQYVPGTHRRFENLIWDIQEWVAAHPGATVLSHDVPTLRHIGFASFRTTPNGGSEESFEGTIHVRSLMGAFRYHPEIGEKVYPLLLTQNGRLQLAKQLMSPEGVIPRRWR